MRSRANTQRREELPERIIAERRAELLLPRGPILLGRDERQYGGAYRLRKRETLIPACVLDRRRSRSC